MTTSCRQPLASSLARGRAEHDQRKDNVDDWLVSYQILSELLPLTSYQPSLYRNSQILLGKGR